MAVVSRSIGCGLLLNGDVTVGDTTDSSNISEVFLLSIDIPTGVSFDWPESVLTRSQFDLWCTAQEALGWRIDYSTIPNPPRLPSTSPA